MMIIHAGPNFAFPPAELEGLAARPIAELVSPPEDIKATSEEPEAGDTIMQAALPSLDSKQVPLLHPVDA